MEKGKEERKEGKQKGNGKRKEGGRKGKDAEGERYSADARE